MSSTHTEEARVDAKFARELLQLRLLRARARDQTARLRAAPAKARSMVS